MVGLGLMMAGAPTYAEDLAGPFNNAPMKTKGMWYLDTRADGVYAMFSEGFETQKGPNLQIYLSKVQASEATGRGDDGDLYIAELKSYKGGQHYKLPKNVDIASYRSVVIVCDRFHKLWAAGDLRPEPRG